jgi:ribosome maturation factor RimP
LARKEVGSAHFFFRVGGDGQTMKERPSPRNPILEEDLTAEIAAIVEGAQCELVHTEFKGGVLKVLIDRPDGVNLTHCEQVSRQVSALLDVVDFGTRRYVLEVSSPGLDRQLYRTADYERFTGRLVRVTFFGAPGGGKQTVIGRLAQYRPGAAGADGAGGGISVLDEQSGVRHEIAMASIAVARLEIEL